MEWAALLKAFQEWGPPAIIPVLVILMVYLIKKVNTNSVAEQDHAENLKKYFESKVKELREDTAKVLDEHGRKLSYIELEYIRRETFYRELGGWKDDINRLSSQISTQFMEFTKNIIELWKEKRDQ